jgi:hypothetical protein
MLIEVLEIAGVISCGTFLVDKLGIVQSFKAGWRSEKAKLAATTAVPVLPLVDDLYARAIASQDREDRRLTALVPGAFWLHPDRWKGIDRPNPRDPGADWFFLRVRDAMKPSVDQVLDECIAELEKMGDKPVAKARSKYAKALKLTPSQEAIIAQAKAQIQATQDMARVYKDQEDYEQNDPEALAWSAERARAKVDKAQKPRHYCGCGKWMPHRVGECSLAQARWEKARKPKELPCGCDYNTNVRVEKRADVMETWTTCLNCHAQWQPASNDSFHRRLAKGEVVHSPQGSLLDTGANRGPSKPRKTIL